MEHHRHHDPYDDGRVPSGDAGHAYGPASANGQHGGHPALAGLDPRRNGAHHATHPGVHHATHPGGIDDRADAGRTIDVPPAPVTAYPAPQRAPTPKAERVNRNVLVIAGVVMGTIGLASVVFVQPNRGGATRTVAPPPETAPASYLDAPVRGAAPYDPAGGTSGGTPSGGAPGVASGSTTGALGPEVVSAGPDVASGANAYGRSAGSGYGAYPGAYPSTDAGYAPIQVPVQGAYVEVPSRPAPRPDPRRAAYEAALAAPLVAGDGPLAAGDDASPASPMGAAMAPGMAGAGGTALGVPDGLPATHQERFLAVARRAGGSASAPTARSRAAAAVVPSSATRLAVEAAPGPYALSAGTMLPAVLVTEINSDLPGDILAQVNRDVYDSESQRRLLVPRGSRLLGRYDHQLAMNQNRLLVAWTRLIFPDGRSVTLPGLQAVDGRGAGGLRDQVDRHGKRAFGTAALLSVVGAAAQLAQPGGGYGLLNGPSTGQVVAGAAGTQLAQVATQLLQRDLQVQPTIRIRQGMPFNVFLTTDLVFPGVYGGGAGGSDGMAGAWDGGR